MRSLFKVIDDEVYVVLYVFEWYFYIGVRVWEKCKSCVILKCLWIKKKINVFGLF